MIFIITPAAEQDIAEAAGWYNSIDSKLSFDFRHHLQDAFDQIIDHPDAHTPVARGLRRVLVRRFSYCIYYRRHKEAIQIVAVIHTGRHPRVWQSRMH